MKIYIVFVGYTNLDQHIKGLNVFYAGYGFGRMNYVTEWRTTSGRTDTLISITGTLEQLRKFEEATYNNNNPPMYLQKYIDKYRSIIPSEVLANIEKMNPDDSGELGIEGVDRVD